MLHQIPPHAAGDVATRRMINLHPDAHPQGLRKGVGKIGRGRIAGSDRDAFIRATGRRLGFNPQPQRVGRGIPQDEPLRPRWHREGNG